MKLKLPTLLYLSLLSLAISSCAKNSEESTILSECTYVQDENSIDGYIDDTERSLMVECYNSRMSNKNEIKTNLLGEWKLIGHGEGWVPKVAQPCATLLFTENELIIDYEDSHVNTTTTHTWDLDEIDINTPQSFVNRLTITPSPNIWLGLSVFCDQYMYGDSTPSDGNMYLFEKVQ